MTRVESRFWWLFGVKQLSVLVETGCFPTHKQEAGTKETGNLGRSTLFVVLFMSGNVGDYSTLCCKRQPASQPTQPRLTQTNPSQRKPTQTNPNQPKPTNHFGVRHFQETCPAFSFGTQSREAAAMKAWVGKNGGLVLFVSLGT